MNIKTKTPSPFNRCLKQFRGNRGEEKFYIVSLT